MDEAIAMSFTTGMPIARAGIDIALWDVVGKLENRSIAELWGRKPGGKLKLSWTVNARTIDEVDQIMKDGQDRGCRDFNIKVAPDPKFGVELARRVRKNTPDGFLWADANGISVVLRRSRPENPLLSPGLKNPQGVPPCAPLSSLSSASS